MWGGLQEAPRASRGAGLHRVLEKGLHEQETRRHVESKLEDRHKSGSTEGRCICSHVTTSPMGGLLRSKLEDFHQWSTTAFYSSCTTIKNFGIHLADLSIFLAGKRG